MSNKQANYASGLTPSPMKRAVLPTGTWCSLTSGTRGSPDAIKKSSKKQNRERTNHISDTNRCNDDDSSSLGYIRLQALLGNHCSVTSFMNDYWEKEHVLIRSRPSSCQRFANLCTKEDVERLLDQGALTVPRDLSATVYRDGTRIDLAQGKEFRDVTAETALGDWFTKKKGSLRILQPQAYLDGLWNALSELEEYFQIPWGANTYLTPAGSQGFSPHFDDVNVFICQVEGSKRWRLYDGGVQRARFSSEDYGPDDNLGRELLNVVLNPGDLLFVPRGTIHQADTLETNIDSLHVTLSTAQRWTWADLIEKTIKPLLSDAARTTAGLRQSLPFRFGDSIGIAPQGRDASKEKVSNLVKSSFEATFVEHTRTIFAGTNLDSVADVMSAKFINDRMPPSPSLRAFSRPRRNNEASTPQLGTSVRLIFRGAARLVLDDDGETPLLIHCLSNKRQVGAAVKDTDAAVSQRCLPEEAGAVDFIFRAYPGSVRIRDLPLVEKSDRLDLAAGLIEMGVIVSL